MDVRGPIGNHHLGHQDISQLRENVQKSESAKASMHGSHMRDAEESLHVQSAKVTQLVSDLQQLPDVRDAVVSDVLTRLNNGEYLSRDAAEQTAAAILDG